MLLVFFGVLGFALKPFRGYRLGAWPGLEFRARILGFVVLKVWFQGVGC